MDFNLGRVARNMTRNLYGTDILANNLANVGTTGFKRDDAFTDWFVEAVREGGYKSYTSFSQGELIRTDNPLDMAISGNGFFTVETRTGVHFTRNGHFTVDNDGFLENSEGHRLQGENGPISVIGTTGNIGAVEITRTGELYVDGNLVDRLAIASIPDIRRLQKIGTNLFRAPDDILVTQLDPDAVDIRQGILEGSNVQPVSEMVSLIELQRNFESTQRVARAMDQVLGRATQLSDYR